MWNQYGKAGEVTKIDLFKGLFFTHPSVMIKKESIESVGLYTVSKRTIRGQDFDLWCKMYASGFRGYIIDKCLFDYYEDRNKIKETKALYRWNNFVKLKLPLKYDIYAFKELLAIFVPNFLLVRRKRKALNKR